MKAVTTKIWTHIIDLAVRAILRSGNAPALRSQRKMTSSDRSELRAANIAEVKWDCQKFHVILDLEEGREDQIMSLLPTLLWVYSGLFSVQFSMTHNVHISYQRELPSSSPGLRVRQSSNQVLSHYWVNWVSHLINRIKGQSHPPNCLTGLNSPDWALHW